MRRSHKDYENHVSFMDFLMNNFGMMAFIALIAILSITIKAVQSGVKQNAEYLITLAWDDDANTDLDLWVKDPFGHIIYFRNREAGLINLDRDSRGGITNNVTLENGQVVHAGNKEVVSVRAVIPGDYVVGVHYYSGYGSTQAGMYPTGLAAGTSYPMPYKIEIIKLNPVVTPMGNYKGTLEKIRDAQNVVAFSLDAQGLFKELPLPHKNLVYSNIDGVAP